MNSKAHYDVFISCKSEDYPQAENLSAFLRSNGLNPFLASESLRQMGNTAYLDEIDKALDESQHLIVFCTKPEYTESKFVKEEWQTFRNEKLSGRKSGNILTVVKDTVQIGDLPLGLRRYEVIPLSKYKTVLLSYISINETDGNGNGEDGRNSSTEAERKAREERNPKVFNVGNVSFKMIPVEGGTFIMGATSEQGGDANSDENPAHLVKLSGYAIGETQVTQALWKAVMGSNPSYFKGDNLPVEKVSWDDCEEFVRKLNRLTGKNFRLPTEAEWECAARGGNKSRGYKYSGSNDIDAVAWYDGNRSEGTHPVATKLPNELGIYDMSGNVLEWCSDWKGDYNGSSQTNPTGPVSGSYRMLRGGGWNFDARYCRVSYRGYYTPSIREGIIGFRLALSE